jgi:cupin 2 domain-containing protein
VSESDNIFKSLPSAAAEECFTRIGGSGAVRIERIVSRGQASPPGFWYDQDTDEWVMVLRGRAGLRIRDGEEVVELAAGDYISLPAHCRHRVEWTDPEEATVWLAIHYPSS